jgi:hypothetical protein
MRRRKENGEAATATLLIISLNYCIPYGRLERK